MMTGSDNGLETLEEFWGEDIYPETMSKSDIYKLPKVLDAKSLLDVRRVDILFAPFSNRNPDFTSREKLSAYLKWAAKTFQETIHWSSGPIQAISILFELKFKEAVYCELGLSPSSESLSDNATKEGQRLEKEMIDKTLQFYVSSKNQVVVIRADDGCYETPPFKASGENPLANKKKDLLNNLYSPRTARQATQKLASEEFYSVNSEKINRLKETTRLVQLIPCNVLTNQNNRQYTEAKNLFTKLLAENKTLYLKFNETVLELAKNRLFGEFKKLGSEKINQLYKKFFAAGTANIPMEDKIHHLIDQNAFKLLDLALASIKELLTAEIPLFMVSGQIAKNNFENNKGLSYLAYPMYALATTLYGFINGVLTIFLGEEHNHYFRWVDSASLLPTEKSEAILVPSVSKLPPASSADKSASSPSPTSRSTSISPRSRSRLEGSFSSPLLAPEVTFFPPPCIIRNDAKGSVFTPLPTKKPEPEAKLIRIEEEKSLAFKLFPSKTKLEHRKVSAFTRRPTTETDSKVDALNTKEKSPMSGDSSQPNPPEDPVFLAPTRLPKL